MTALPKRTPEPLRGDEPIGDRTERDFWSRTASDLPSNTLRALGPPVVAHHPLSAAIRDAAEGARP